MPPVKKPTRKLMLIIDTVRGYDTHKLNKHVLRSYGEATPANFKKAVLHSYNDASRAGGANIIYSGYILGRRKPRLVAKLYQAKRNTVAPKRYAMFATFHYPDGERLREKAKLTKTWFEKSTKVYPSKPPISGDYKTLLSKMVVY